MAQNAYRPDFTNGSQYRRPGPHERDKLNQGKGRALKPVLGTSMRMAASSPAVDAYEHGFVDELGSFEIRRRQGQKAGRFAAGDLVRYVEYVSVLDTLSRLVKTETQRSKWN